MPKAEPTEIRQVEEAGRRSGPAPDMTASAPDDIAARPDDTVRGVPRRWLRLEGAVLLGGSLVAYRATAEPWWLVPLALLVPDLFMAGYLGGTRLGAQLYNIAHSTVLPAATAGLACWQSKPFVLALGLIWLAHIGLDRLVGYGLKYDDHFQHTHLGIQRAPGDGLHARKEHCCKRNRPGPPGSGGEHTVSIVVAPPGRGRQGGIMQVRSWDLPGARTARGADHAGTLAQVSRHIAYSR